VSDITITGILIAFIVVLFISDLLLVVVVVAMATPLALFATGLLSLSVRLKGAPSQLLMSLGWASPINDAGLMLADTRAIASPVSRAAGVFVPMVVTMGALMLGEPNVQTHVRDEESFARRSNPCYRKCREQSWSAGRCLRHCRDSQGRERPDR
jgi:hypothetical protein